jgi:DNA-binding transcriptional ArsR family regulator
MMQTALLDRTFAALGNPMRRAIVARLSSGAVTVAELARPFGVSAPAISRHLRVLESANLVTQEREGKFRRCRLNPSGLNGAAQWLEFHRRFWTQSFDSLDEHLKSTAKTKGQARKTQIKR